MADQPKRNQRRSFQWGMLLLIIALDVVALLLVAQGRVQTVTATATDTLDPIWQTATAIYLDWLTAGVWTPSLFEHPPLFTATPRPEATQIAARSSP